MYDRVVVTLDGSALSQCALPHAASLAQALNARLILLQVIPYPEVEDQRVQQEESGLIGRSLEHIANGLRGRGIRAEVAIPWGGVVQTIVDYVQAEPNTLVVMSTHGRTGLRKLTLGSVTESVLREAKMTPVLICRCPES